jgi:G3E family GTPase
VLIGGYLGAGKTTLVNHLLRQAGGRRVAVLVNDFGSLNIDADLIDPDGSDASAGVLALSGGCLCCSFGDDLVGTLNGLAQRTPAPDVCLVELSGVALPAAVWRTARLALSIAPVGTLVLADAAEIRRQAADPYVGDTVRQQLQDADWLLLNKPDLVDDAALQATADWLAGLAPQARCWPGAAASVSPELVLGWRTDEGAAGRATATADGADALRAFAARPIGPKPPATNAVFDSHSQGLPSGVDLAALGVALSDPGSGVLRAKGLAVDAWGRGQLLQVAGGRWAVTPAAVQGPGRLVLIGLRGRWDPQSLLAGLLDGSTGATQVPMPTAADGQR